VHGLLLDGFVDVMAAADAAARIDTDPEHGDTVAAPLPFAHDDLMGA
jgi:hypothetical protein